MTAEVLGKFPAPYRAAGIERPGGAAGFSGAIVFRVRTAEGDFCLRGWPADAPPPERILGLHRLLRLVFLRGVTQVPVPIVARSGTTLVRAGGRLWQLEPWMPGVADFQAHPTAERLRQAVGCLAAWHRAAWSFEPTAREAAWFASRSDGASPAVLDRLEQVRRWDDGRLEALARRLDERGSARKLAQSRDRGKGSGRSNFNFAMERLQTIENRQAKLKFERPDPRPHDELREIGRRIVELYRRAAPPIAARLQSAAQIRVGLQPCLRDVWHDHVLFTDDEVTGLIDASACRSETVAADLARLLGSLIGDDGPRWAIALDEYQRHCRLTIDELALVDALDRSGVLLAGLVWLDRLVLQERRFEPMDRVVARLRTILDRLEVLAAR